MKEETLKSSLRILLVENNKHDTRAFRRALKKSKVPYEITHHKRFEEALERIHSDDTAFDIVVSDYELPDRSGLDLFKELRDSGLKIP